MQPNVKKKQLTILAAIFGGIIAVFIIIAIIMQLSQKNEYGDGLRIQNFNAKVKNLSTTMRSSIEATLYNVVDKNVPDTTDLTKVNDANIRDDSNKQDYNKNDDIYTGNFIVDIESLKQSYYVQYTYVKDENSNTGLASRVVITCAEEKDLKFGAFTCSDFVQEQAGKNDEIIQFLPFSNFSFRITADASAGDDNLILKVELRIPSSDLKGDLASDQAVVAMYKSEVTKWMESKNVDPSGYTIQYDYDDNGTPVKIFESDLHGDLDVE